MNNNFKQGKLKRWDDNRGFGFIAQQAGDVFLHLSAFKRAGCRPKVGDSISYQVHTDNKGKVRAVNATIDGAANRRPSMPQRRLSKVNKRSRISEVMTVCLVLLLGVFAYRAFIENSVAQVSPVASMPATPLEEFPLVKKSVTSSFSCNGKVYCSEMTSCGEARFYQRNCPGTKMDGDRDGIPCESQWC